MTKNAYDYLEEYEWIGFYRKYLIYFDFLDFFYYLETREGSIEEISLEYIEKHIELAIESLDYDYIIKSYTTKSKICHKINYLEDALKCDMRILILNMNPICLNYNFYQWHAPLDIENIANLKMLKSKFGEKRLLETFNENWNFMGFKSTLIPKEEVWNHLITALNSKEQNHGSRKLEKNT